MARYGRGKSSDFMATAAEIQRKEPSYADQAVVFSNRIRQERCRTVTNPQEL